MTTGDVPTTSPPPTPSRQWTPQQRAAMGHARGDLLVSAAAGSGKTAVLAERCARLICGMPEPGSPRAGMDNLLVLTFTEAAAAEMRTRIAAALREKLRGAPTPPPAEAGGQRWLSR